MSIVSFSNAQKRGKRPEISHKDISYFKDPKHPLYDVRIKLPLDAEFAENLKERGILQNVLLWRDGEALFPIAGLQRVRHVEWIDEKDGVEIGIPYTIVSGTIEELLEMRFSENAQRVNPSATLNAANAAVLLRFFSEERVAQTLRVGGVANLRILLKLNDLDPAVAKLVDSGEIGQTLAALEIAKLPRDQASADAMREKSGSAESVLTQMQMVEKLRSNGTMKGEAAKEAVRKVRDKKNPGEDDDDDSKSDGDTKRMRSRAQVKRFYAKVRKVDEARALFVAATLKWMLGDDTAFSKAGLAKIDVAACEALEAPVRKNKKASASK